jgi:hypothetical protein
MEKTYRLTLDIKVQINEEIKGASSQKIRDYTREIINCFLSDPLIYNTYYRILLSENYVPDTAWIDTGESLDLNEFYENFLRLSKKVSPEAGNYLLELIYSHPEDPEEFDKNEQNMELIHNHLNNFKVTHVDVREIKNEKNVPQKNTIPVEAKAEGEIQGLSL